MNLAHLVDPHPDGAPALIDEAGQVTTYRELRKAAGDMRARLVAAGVGPDDRVAIVSANDSSFVVAYLAILGVGAVAVPLNPGSPPAELARELSQVRVAAVLTGPGGGHAAIGLSQAALAEVPAVDMVEPDGSPVEGVEPDGSPVEGVEPDGTVPPIVDRGPGDLAVLLFTAGTSGAARPAMLTHGNLLANLDQVQRHPGRALNADDVSLGVLPLFHIFGLNVLLGGSLLVGAAVLLMDRFGAAATLELIQRHHVTILLGAPTMYAAMAALPPSDPERAELAGVRLAFSGAAALSAEVAGAFERRFHLALRQGYGLTEASPVVTSSVTAEPPRKGSIGVPIPGVEVRLVDDEDEDALRGDPGEIWVRGPNVFPGYWEDPKATGTVLSSDGWLRTGDVAVAGDDGELYIVDRSKDLIIVSGFNVFPAEVEDVLMKHPGVADVAVVGEPDPARGESVHAFVVPENEAEPPSADELRAWCTERIARYKCPTEITIVPSLPHGLGGKLLRRALRAGLPG